LHHSIGFYGVGDLISTLEGTSFGIELSDWYDVAAKNMRQVMKSPPDTSVPGAEWDPILGEWVQNAGLPYFFVCPPLWSKDDRAEFVCWNIGEAGIVPLKAFDIRWNRERISVGLDSGEVEDRFCLPSMRFVESGDQISPGQVLGFSRLTSTRLIRPDGTYAYA
jgi:hypothetical protein